MSIHKLMENEAARDAYLAIPATGALNATRRILGCTLYPGISAGVFFAWRTCEELET